MIDKKSIIITSLGRTGTKFFSTLLSDIINDSYSIHEPDIFTFDLKYKKGLRHAIEQLKESGILNLFLKKLVGKWSIINYSDARFKNQIVDIRAINNIINQRKYLINSIKCNIYIESSIAYYALLDLLNT